MEGLHHRAAAAGIGGVEIAFLQPVRIEVVFHHRDAGGARGADAGFDDVDGGVAPRTAQDDVAHGFARRSDIGKHDVAGGEAARLEQRDTGLEVVFLPGETAIAQDHMGDADLAEAPEAARVHFGVHHRAQAYLGRVGAFVRHEGVGWKRPCGAASGQQRAAVQKRCGHAFPRILRHSAMAAGWGQPFLRAVRREAVRLRQPPTELVWRGGLMPKRCRGHS